MKKLSLLFVLCFLVSLLKAKEGDTTKILVHDKTHLNYYGNFDKKALFPDSSKSFHQIRMKYTLGCPTSGCSEWDYTTQVFIRKHTGVDDSSQKTYPSLKVNKTKKDSAEVKFTPTFTYSFNTNTKEIDSVQNDTLLIYLYNNPNDISKISETIIAWKANYYKPIFDINGVQTDSVLIKADTVYYNQNHTRYELFEKIEDYELGRVITPYAGNYPTSWMYNYYFDVTDYRKLLMDSVEIRVHFSGYQDGFAATIEFEMIEGTPAYEVAEITMLWNGSSDYGNPNNSIENFLNAKNIKIGDQTDRTVLKVIQTGHGFGGNENCAEFCPKDHYIKVNGTTKYTTKVWREDCGSNPLYPQAGTWLYDRSNWCPGTDVQPYIYELTDFAPSNSNTEIDMDMEAFTNNGNNFCSYIISGILFQYKKSTVKNDVAIVDIISPNNDFRFNRRNPICSNPIIKVKNNGENDITSLQIKYGNVGDNNQNQYTWKGELKAFGTIEIELAPITFDGDASAIFEAEIIKIDGYENTDDVKYNNHKTSQYDKTPVFPDEFILYLTTNKNPEQNQISITNDQGKEVFNKSYSIANTLHKDTVKLTPGCYKLELKDSERTGLDFFALRQYEGSGSFSIRKMGSGLVKSFGSDFGTNIVQYFTVGFTMDVKNENKDLVEIYPNPASDVLTINNLTQNGIAIFYDVTGKEVLRKDIKNGENKLDISYLAKGVYFIQINTANKLITNKLIVK